MADKILLADKLPDSIIDGLKALGLEVDSQPTLGENDLPGAIKGAKYLVVRSTKVNAKTFDAADALKMVVRAGAGYNTIDVDAAAKAGVAVCNTPGKNSIAVAELAMGLIVSLDRRLPDNVADFRKGVWNKAGYSKAEGVYGKTLALVGVGNIGKEVAKRALAFGMKVYGKDVVPIDVEGVEAFADYDAVLPNADYVSIHLPSNAETRGMIDKAFLARMKEGAALINTSRAELVDQAALIDAVKNRGLRAALDVFEDEPEQKTGEVTSDLQALEGVYVTHHIGASTAQAQFAVAEETLHVVKTFQETGEPLHKVN
ncbi:MAG: phosphoglycerate dehydrogenase [Ignavibacteriales bacterium]|nr:phosphoglycerate dehydrogenase [Ignavibacteriales bacterium]